jgi:hypothetical protein
MLVKSWVTCPNAISTTPDKTGAYGSNPARVEGGSFKKLGQEKGLLEGVRKGIT